MALPDHINSLNYFSSYDPNRFTPKVSRISGSFGGGAYLKVILSSKICYLSFTPGACPMGAQVTPKTILIVDDEETIRSTLALVLEDEGFHCLLAKDAETALQIIEENTIDLLITDLCLPHVDGLQLLTLFKQRSADVVVIVITNYSDEETAERALSMGAAEYILKPLDLNELIERVYYHLGLI